MKQLLHTWPLTSASSDTSSKRPIIGKHHEKIRQFTVATLVSSLLLVSSANLQANDRRVATERFTEFAPVINVEPIYQQARIRTPRQECWTETQQVIVGYEDVVIGGGYSSSSSQSSRGNAIVGGVIGGLIGNQLGRGHSSRSRTGATVAGAIIGGAIGNETGERYSRHRNTERPRRVESRPIYETQEVERCKRSTESSQQPRLQYYNVTYRYKGRTFVTQMPRDPGNQIELQVSVSPARR